MRGGELFELPMSERLTVGSVSSSLLPTATAEDGERGIGADAARAGGKTLRGALLPTPSAEHDSATQDPETFLARRERIRLERKGEHPAGNGFGLTLSMQVQLLPTPGANDHTGPEGPTRWARQDEGETGGPALRDLAYLLPTPGARDGRGKSGWKDREPDALTDKVALLPTPVANPDNPGAGGELRAALTLGPGRRNETGTDSLGRPNEGRPSRLLPTPTAGDAASSGSRNLEGSKAHAGVSLTDAIQTGDSRTPRRGDPTPLLSNDGSELSADELPAQLTIEDA